MWFHASSKMACVGSCGLARSTTTLSERRTSPFGYTMRSCSIERASPFLRKNAQMDAIPDIDAVLFDFSDVVGRMRMALAGEPGEGPYRIELIPEVVEVIEQLRSSGVRVGLITNNDRDAFFHHAPHINLDSLFDVVVFSSDIGVSKPGF